MKSLVVLTMMCGVAGADPVGSGSNAGVNERARLEVQPPGKAIKQLAIDNPLGDVRVEGYDGTALQIETHKHAPDAESLNRLRISLIPNTDGTVRIMTTADGGPEYSSLARGAVRIDVVVRAPRNVRIDAAASSGALEMMNMDAGGELDTASGAITVHNVAGTLSTHTLSGAMTLAQVFGMVDAQAVTSDLQLDTITGDRLVASVSHGKIAGRRVRSRQIELTTTDGTIVLEAEVALNGKLVISSISGDLDVKVHRHGPALVRAKATKVDLGSLAATPSANGWMSVAVAGDGQPAAIDLQSRTGFVRFAFVQ